MSPAIHERDLAKGRTFRSDLLATRKRSCPQDFAAGLTEGLWRSLRFAGLDPQHAARAFPELDRVAVLVRLGGSDGLRVICAIEIERAADVIGVVQDVEPVVRHASDPQSKGCYGSACDLSVA